MISQTAPSLLTRYLYTGRELDPETGLMYYRARFYDPTLGKFIQREVVSVKLRTLVKQSPGDGWLAGPQ